jgi:hypothetical protein
MRNLNEIECFVKAVELKSLTAAAKALKLPKSKIRTKNRSGNFPSREDSDDSRSVHAGRRNTRRAGRIPERCGDEHCGELKEVG